MQFLRRSATLQASLKTPNLLHEAVAQKDLGKLRARLEKVKKAKPELNVFDHMDQTPIFAAMRQNNIEAVRELLNFYTTSKQDVNIKDKSGNTALHIGTMFCDEHIVMMLLAFPGIDVNALNNDGDTPLHTFCSKFRYPNCQEAFQQFVKLGANVNAQNKSGETPLHKAIFNNTVRLLLVNLLLEANADVNKLKTRGDSPLHLAVKLGRETLVDILIRAGADATIIGVDGKTCFELALQGSNQMIIDTLKSGQEIYDWLKGIGVEQYWNVFVKNELNKSLLPDLTEHALDSMGITTAPHRVKILKACKMLAMDPKEQQMLATSVPQAASSKPSAAKVSASAKSTSEAMRATPQNFTINYAEIEYTDKLGSGASGKVYKGLFRGQQVAVKIVKQGASESCVSDFKKECQIMAAVRSPFLVSFYGACTEPKMCMVMEFCSLNTLYHVMNSEKYQIGWDLFFKFSLQMAMGMECLHTCTPQIVHRDFKSLNLLINDSWDCKVSDFGLSRFNTAENLETLGQIRGTFAYCAPEVASGSGVVYTSKSDVYSIGIVLWEMITRIITGEYFRPFSEYAHIKMDFQIMLCSKEGLRPTLPSHVPKFLNDTYKMCVSQNPQERISCAELVERLKTLENDWKTNEKSWWDLLRKR